MLGMRLPVFDAEGNTSVKKLARNLGDADFANPFWQEHLKQ